MCWQIPIFPGRLQPSIFGTSELNFRVRNGNGWTLTVKNTNSRLFQLIQYIILRQPSQPHIYLIHRFP